jgi:hypothetical protein
MSNDMSLSEGRLGNQIIRALAASFVAKQNNLKFNYGKYFDKIKELGINLFIDGSLTFNTEFDITDKNLIHCINIPIFRNINVNKYFFQTREFSNYLYNYYKKSKNQESIIKNNIFNSRYNNNDDLFVHVRLGDVAHLNQGFSYYDKAISKLTFNNGYIASDDIENKLCKELIKKYSLNIIDYNEIHTIMFGSTCKYIVLSGGSFSYIIGLLGFFSNIYYLKGKNDWYPSELYYIDDWTEIDI